MSAFRKFDPYSFLKDHEAHAWAANLAKDANFHAVEEPSLADLATLAATVDESRNDAGDTTRIGTPDSICGQWDGEREERAAIAEYCGGAPRAWAEALARLDPDKTPDTVPLQQWRTFVDDCGSFLDDGWAARADALGWSPYNLFGCDRRRPFARLDHQGLLWILKGRRLVELRGDAAVIETESGAQLTFRRTLPSDPKCVVLPWELAP
jgi:hypothetical protein